MELLQTAKEYSESCTIHGIAYIFSVQHVFERVFWIIIVITGIVLATFFSVEAYSAWSDFPLITSVSTTALPIEDIDWPSVTVCNQGRGLGLTDRVYQTQVRRYIKEKGKDIDTMTVPEVREEEIKFMEQNYPGLSIDLPTLIDRMTSNNPDRANAVYVMMP